MLGTGSAPLQMARCLGTECGLQEASRNIGRHRLQRPPTKLATTAKVPRRRDELVACLHLLPRREREAIVLRYICELAEPEVALALAVSARTVKARLQSAVASLRANIDVDIEEESVHEPHT